MPILTNVIRARRKLLPALISVSFGSLILLGATSVFGAETKIVDDSHKDGSFDGQPGDHLLVQGKHAEIATKDFRNYFNSDTITANGSRIDVQQGGTVGKMQVVQSKVNVGMGDDETAHSGAIMATDHSTLHLDNVVVLGEHSPGDENTLGQALVVSDAAATMTKRTLIDNQSDTDLYAFGVFVNDHGSLTVDGSTIRSGGAALSASSAATVTLNNASVTGDVRGVGVSDGAHVAIVGGTMTATNKNDVIDSQSYAGYEGHYAAGVSMTGLPVTPSWHPAMPTVDISHHALIQGTGQKSVGFLSDNGGSDANASITDSTVSGHDAGILFEQLSRPDRRASGVGLTTVTLIDSLVESQNGPAILATTGTKNTLLLGRGTRLNGANDVALQTSAGSQTDVTVDNSQIAGNMVNNGGTTSITLRNGARWTGAMSNVTGMTVNSGSEWDLTGASSVTGDLVNMGTVSVAHDQAAGNTLTVEGNYTGDNALLRLNGILNGDNDSVVDKVLIKGNAGGTSRVAINKVGGTGAQTVNGLEVIHVNGTATDNAFIQSGRIVAGAYDYKLTRGTGANHNDWVLNSTLSDPNPAPPVHMLERPEVGSYIANLAAVNTLFNTSLHDRLGEPRYENEMKGQNTVSSLWLRQVGIHNSFHDSGDQLKTQSNSYVAQLGGEVVQWTTDGLDRFHLGVMAGYANNHNDTVALTGYHSKGSVNGYSSGLYGTWYANDNDRTGLYVDGWAQYNWFNSTVQGNNLASESYKSKGITASLESGYALKLGQSGTSENSVGYFIEPNAQVTWMGVKSDDVTEENGTRVKGLGNHNIQTRLGSRLYLQGHSHLDNGKDRTFQPYVEANWIHNTQAFGVNMNGATFYQAGARNIGELKVGIEGKLSRHLRLWGNVGQQIGDKGYSNTAAMLGIKVSF
jgi:autotransporter family porin